MRAPSMPSTLACALLAALVTPLTARADDQPIDLVYRSFEGCPSERQFIEMVVGRAAKNLVASERARGRKFQITVKARGADTLGKLEITTGVETASREVTGTNCGEVVSALALFTALAIDPAASIEPAPPKPADEPPKPDVRPAVAPRPKEIDLPSSPAPGASHRSQWRAGARVVGAGGFPGGSAMPAASGGAGLFLQWSTPGFGIYRASGAYFVPVETDRATFHFVSGRFDGCPVDVPLGRSTVLEPCIGVELGGVTAAAKATSDLEASTERRWWVAGDLLLRTRFSPFPWIFSELEVGAVVPFTRYVFLLGTEAAPRGEAHQVPGLGWVLGFSVGGRIL